MVKVMVDSASDCRGREDVYDIFVPISINIGGKEYFDGVDIDNDTFYSLLLGTKDFPSTSQPSPDAFIKHFEQARDDGDELIYFAISSALSGTYQGAFIARDMVGYDGIYIVDTLTATHMIGVLAGYAKQLIAQGLSAAQIARECEDLRARIRAFAGLDTLEYLRRGGRLSNASAAVGTLANIKPVVTVTADGRVEAVGKSIGCGRAMQLILDKVGECGVDDSFPVCSLYTCGEENCAKLEAKLTEAGYTLSERLQVGSTIGTHVGPGVYGVCFVAKN